MPETPTTPTTLGSFTGTGTTIGLLLWTAGAVFMQRQAQLLMLQLHSGVIWHRKF